MNKTMTSIAKELNITLSSQDTINYSASTYSEIFMGKYKDKEFEFISFFHELGHIKIKQEFIKKWKYNTLTIELECWNIGLEEARRRNIFFSDKAIEWGFNKALSYVGRDEREYSN